MFIINEIINYDKFEYKIFNKILILSIVVVVSNLFFYESKLIMYGIITIESAILILKLIEKKYIEFFSYYVIFLSLSYEFGVFLSDVEGYIFYSFKNTNVLGLNLGLIFILVFLMIILLKFKYKISKYKTLNRFIFVFILVTFIAAITGLISILINDNNIQLMPSYLAQFIKEIYPTMFLISLIIGLLFAITHDESNKILHLEYTLLSVMISGALGLLIAYIFNIKGVYGGADTLVTSNVTWLVPFLLLVPFYYKNKIINSISIILGTIGITLIVTYSANGKIIIFSFITIFLIIILLLRNLTYRKVFIIITIPVWILAIIVFYVKFLSNQVLFQSKLNQVLGLVMFYKEGWLENMPASPKIRIVEFFNILLEYYNKPMYLPFGKGFLGTVQDHLNEFGSYNRGAFSDAEYDNNAFFAMHESLNTIFLRNGILGLLFITYIIKLCIVNFNKNYWLLLGSTWFIVFYDYSVTIGIFGVTALVIGLIKINNR